MSSACCVLLDSLRLSLLLFAFHLLSHLPFHSPDHLHLPCWVTRTLRTLANEESGTIAENNPLTGTRSVQTLETSEEARGWNGWVNQPKVNDRSIVDGDAHHRETERTNVQQGKQHEDEDSIHSRINAYTIRSCRGVRT